MLNVDGSYARRNIMANGNPNFKLDWIFVFCMFYELIQRLHALHVSCITSEFTFKLYKFTVTGLIVVDILKNKIG